jgi:preprotein translocase subunit SecA
LISSLPDPWLFLPLAWRLHRARRLAGRILQHSAAWASLDSAALLERSLALRYRAQCGEPLDRLLVEAYALVREAARRTVGLQHFETQLLGGILLQRRPIAEMQTGEGKTLTATLPLYLAALPGHGTHLATANDYLARRDADWVRPLFSALGLSVGAVLASQSARDRRAAYQCDVTYGTAREFGFDFLRDRLRARDAAQAQGALFAAEETERSSPAPVQRGLHYLLADEADSLLIDEARMPLVISGSSPGDVEADVALFRWSAAAARSFTDGADFTIDPSQKRVALTAVGRERARLLPQPRELSRFSLPELYEALERGVRAEKFYLRDRHYVIRNDRVIIVDEFTGRPAEGRQWRDGLHQAMQAKEGLPITPASVSAAQITAQEFFLQYRRLAGMTGTAATSTAEFRSVYALTVTPIPTHRPCRRIELPVRVLPGAREKWLAIVAEIREMHDQGRPVLVGTRSIDKSEEIAALLSQAGIEHRVLHARNLAAEADIIAQAGQLGRVTVATNLAGRGTDIRLGPGVADVGGLHVVCSELHDAARIDRQLTGRCARQGDPGSYRQFLALDDEILESGLGPERAARWRARFATSQRSLDFLAPQFRRAQQRIERQHRSDRRLLLYQAGERRLLHERMGQDPWLDAE